MASVIPNNVAVGDEECPTIAALDDSEQRARLSHTDGSHTFPQLTYNQRIELGSMLLELAGDV